jgi:hypothetical protein
LWFLWNTKFFQEYIDGDPKVARDISDNFYNFPHDANMLGTLGSIILINTQHINPQNPLFCSMSKAAKRSL